MGAAYARQGHMTAAVNAIIPFAFGDAEAASDRGGMHPCQRRVDPAPGETGFKREGFARQYLCIDGAWQDHLLYARLKDDLYP